MNLSLSLQVNSISKKYYSELEQVATYLNNTIYNPQLNKVIANLDKYSKFPLVKRIGSAMKLSITSANREVNKYKLHPLS